MLVEIFDRYGSDKGTGQHRYDWVYEPILESLQLKPITLLEIGIFRGASLASWVEYLPNAMIIGVDTFERVPPQDIPILLHPRVEWYRCDSTSGVPDELRGRQVDIVIDDGCHDPEAQLATLRNFRPLVRPGGRYFIEDAPHLMVPGALVHDLTAGRSSWSRVLEFRC